MNKTKRILALMLAVVMMFGMFPINAKADGETPETCEYCSVELTEGAEHAPACPTNCTCDPKPAEGEAHAEGCVLYVAADPADADDEEPEDEDTTEPSSEPTEPSSEPTEPSSEPTEPSSEPTEPSSEPTEPSSEPTEPSSEPTEPSSEPTEPSPEPTEPSKLAGNTTLEGSVDGTTFALVGSSIPEGAEAVIEKSDPAMLDALAGLGISGGSADLFDISVEVEGEKWQPGAAVMLLTADAEPVDNTITMSIDGLDVEAGQEVTIYHLFDEPNAIMNAYMAEKALELDISGHEDMFEKELEAASYFEAGEGIIFYEVIEMVAAQDGMVTFDTQSFSTYVVASGTTTIGVSPWGAGFILNENNTYYVMPNTKLTLYSSDTKWTNTGTTDLGITAGTARKWTVSTNNHGIKTTTSNSYKFTFYIKAGDSYIGDTFTIKSNNYTATIVVTSLEDVVKKAISNDWYDVYVSSVVRSDQSLPGEPSISSTSRIFLDKYAQNAKNIVKTSFATAAQLTTSSDGTCTVGIVDATGANIIPHINIDWDTQLTNIVNKAAKQSVTLYAADGSKVTSSNKGNYTLVPYVVKLQTANGYGSWNIDCYIVPDSTMRTLRYTYNLPSGLSYDASVPNTVVGVNNFTTTVAKSPGVGNKTLTDPSGTQYVYRFTGWNTKADGSGTSYAPEASITVKSNVVLYAQWSPRYQYTLNFNFKSGTGSHTTIATSSWQSSNSYKFTWTAEDPTRTNYKFKGWSTDGDNTTVEIAAGTKTYTMKATSADKGLRRTETIYAVWAPLYNYVLNFDMKGGSNGPSNITSGWLETSSNTFSWTAEPTKTGYTFAGWSTGDDNTPEILAGTKSYQVSGTAAGTKTTTLYACWTVKKYGYTVKYLDKDTNAVIATQVSGTADYGSTVKGTQQSITGYTFSSVSPSGGSITIGTTDSSNVITYYYTENKATINYHVVGASDCGTVKQNGTGTTGTKVSETLKVVTGSPVGATATASSHYTFVGWYDNAACTGNPVSTNASYIPTRASDTHWAADDYYAKFVENDATINYQVAGNVGGSVTPGSETLKVLTGTANGSTATPADGYRFVGWYSDDACTNLVSASADFVPEKTGDAWVNGTTYWAKFEELTAPIHYVVDGPDGCGTVDLNDTDDTTVPGTEVSETVEIVTGNPVGATAAAADHYTFIGWYDSDNNLLSEDPSYDPAKSGTFWTEATYTAKFEENDATLNYQVAGNVGGSVTPGSETLKVLTDSASGSTATVADGYRFLGWYTDADCTNQVSTELHYTPARPEDGWVDGTTYWAKFEELTVPIHYQVVGPDGCGTVNLKDNDAATTAGRNVTETVPAATGNAVGATAETANSNFKFVGWYSDEACTNQISTDAYYDPQKPEGIWVEKTYYAKFVYSEGHLTISKTGIDALDHHDSSNGTNQEQQTTVYSIVGTASNGTAVDLEVAIVGNSAITVYNIPVGTYTVTEKGSWSWRYDEAAADSKTATITGGETTTLAFSNERKNASWLSGDNFLRNLFTAITN